MHRRTRPAPNRPPRTAPRGPASPAARRPGECQLPTASRRRFPSASSSARSVPSAAPTSRAQTYSALSQNRPGPSRCGPVGQEDLPPQFDVAGGNPRRVLPAAAVKGSSSSGVAAARADATRCGRWLVRARAASWSSGRMRTTRAPSDCQNSSIVSTASWSDISRSRYDDHATLEQIGPGRLGPGLFAAGHRMAADEWHASETDPPAPPRPAQRSLALVLPASVIRLPSGQCRPASATCCGDQFDRRADDDQARPA